jgi:phenylpyruvate tautomerase
MGEKMPYFKIETNKSMEKSYAEDFAREASFFACRLLGKPEKYMMISVNHSASMMFGGSVEPTAYVQLKSISLSPEKCAAYSKSICEFMQSSLGISPDRIYVDFKNIDGSMFGWNKGTF